MARISYTEGYSDKSVLKQIYDLKKGKQDKLTAGENITITDDGVISATGGGSSDVTKAYVDQQVATRQPLGDYATRSEVSTGLAGKQDVLVSGTNIKTINNESILGSGNIVIQGGGSSYTEGKGIDITSDVISIDESAKMDWSDDQTFTSTTDFRAEYVDPTTGEIVEKDAESKSALNINVDYAQVEPPYDESEMLDWESAPIMNISNEFEEGMGNSNITIVNVTNKENFPESTGLPPNQSQFRIATNHYSSSIEFTDASNEGGSLYLSKYGLQLSSASKSGEVAVSSEIMNPNWSETDPSMKSFIQNKPNLATVATSGSYNDLSDKPMTLPSTSGASIGQVCGLDSSMNPAWITVGGGGGGGAESNVEMFTFDQSTGKWTSAYRSLDYADMPAYITAHSCLAGNTVNYDKTILLVNFDTIWIAYDSWGMIYGRGLNITLGSSDIILRGAMLSFTSTGLSLSYMNDVILKSPNYSQVTPTVGDTTLTFVIGGSFPSSIRDVREAAGNRHYGIASWSYVYDGSSATVTVNLSAPVASAGDLMITWE